MSVLFGLEWAPFWTALAAFGAIGAVAVAAVSTRISWQLLRTQSDPKVIVYTRPDAERQSILVIRIENIGRDIAADVTFSPSRPIPENAFGLDPTTAPHADAMQDGPLVTGIPALGPGDYREITWGQFGGLAKALDDKPIVLDYSYQFGSRTLRGRTSLEVTSYRGANAAERAIAKAARQLEAIAKSVEILAARSRDSDDGT